MKPTENRIKDWHYGVYPDLEKNVSERPINEAESLPMEARAIVVDSSLRSLDPPESEVDKKWTAAARGRMKEIRTGNVEAIPGDEVFAKIWKKFEQ